MASAPPITTRCVARTGSAPPRRALTQPVIASASSTATNVTGMRAAGGGCIVHMASPAAIHGFPTAGVYSAVKGAVAAYTRQSAVELAPDGIRVNAVVPGAVPTPGAREVVDDAGYEYRRSRTPLGRLGTPEDIAGAVSFLASEDASFMTGQLLVVDGGITVA